MGVSYERGTPAFEVLFKAIHNSEIDQFDPFVRVGRRPEHARGVHITPAVSIVRRCIASKTDTGCGGKGQDKRERRGKGGKKNEKRVGGGVGGG